MRLKFIRNNDNFVIIADENDGIYKIKLMQLYVEFRKIKVDTSVLSREMAALETTPDASPNGGSDEQSQACASDDA